MELVPKQLFINLQIAVLAVGILSGCNNRGANAPVAATGPAAASAPAAKASYDKLVGKWRRQEGGYILEITSVAADGKMDAGYLNPRTIHVEKAVASTEGTNIKAFIELRDVNYPGSTYTLTYNAAGDSLTGDYFPAVTKDPFGVTFTRMKP